MSHTPGASPELWSARLKPQEGRTGRLLVTLCIGALLFVSAGCGEGGEVFSSTATTAAPAAAQPTPGAALCGEIEIGAMAAGGAICLTISDDGTSITGLEVALTEVACDGLTAGTTVDHFSGSLASIADGRFGEAIPAVLTASGHQSQGVLTSGESMMGTGPGGTTSFSDYRLDVSPEEFPVVASLETVGQLEGEFSSATEAAGTITIHVWVVGSDRACELGTFAWSASAQ